MLGMMSAVPFLPLYILELGVVDPQEAKLWSGFIFSAPFMLSIFTVPIWGALGDKYGLKLMLVRAMFGLALAVTLMAFVQNIWQLFFLRIFQGAISGFIAAALAFTSATTPENKSGFAISILQSSLSAGIIFGPLFGGIIADIRGIRPVFLIIGVLCLFSGLFVIIFVKEKRINKSKKRTSVITNLHYITKQPVLLFILLLIVLTQGGLHFTNPIFPYFVKSLNAPEEYLSTIVGSLVGMVGIFSIIFAAKWGRRNDRKDWRGTLMLASTVSGIALLAHIVVPQYYYLFPLRALIGIFFSAMMPTLYSALSKRVPTDNKGGIMGLASSATLIGPMFGYLICGTVASMYGMEVTFVLSAGALLLVAFLLKIVRRFELTTTVVDS